MKEMKGIRDYFRIALSKNPRPSVFIRGRSLRCHDSDHNSPANNARPEEVCNALLIHCRAGALLYCFLADPHVDLLLVESQRLQRTAASQVCRVEELYRALHRGQILS